MKVPLPLRVETVIERLIFRSRWLALPFYAGLMISLLTYAYAFSREIFNLVITVNSSSSESVLVTMLTLVDKVLIANLIVTVIIAGYENSVSRLNISKTERSLSWLGKLDASSLKAKLATSVVTIAFVRLLLIFLDIEQTSDRELYGTIWLFGTMLIGALIVSLLDYLSSQRKALRNVPDEDTRARKAARVKRRPKSQV